MPLPPPPGAGGTARTGELEGTGGVALSGNGRVLSLVNGSSGSSPSLVTSPPPLTQRSGPSLAPNRNKARKDFWLPGGGGCCFHDRGRQAPCSQRGGRAGTDHPSPSSFSSFSSSRNVLISSSPFSSGGSREVSFVLPLTLVSPLARGQTPVTPSGRRRCGERRSPPGPSPRPACAGSLARWWPAAARASSIPRLHPMVLPAREPLAGPLPWGAAPAFPHVPNLHFSPVILGLKEERISVLHPQNAHTHFPNRSWVSEF